ncbi:MAG: DinB family protein [Planctomycetes bacterium]|nr:DinB family protein [Planctomycetota bacterium]
MTSKDRLVEDLRRAVSGDPWHGPSLDAVLRGVDAVAASAHLIPGLHSIWENVVHITVWAREAARRVQGHPVQTPAEGDWPAVGATSEPRWTAARADLAAAHQELEQALAGLPEGRLDEKVGATRDAALGAGYSFAVLVNGVLQHDAYHGGQIALLKKALAAPRPS